VQHFPGHAESAKGSSTFCRWFQASLPSHVRGRAEGHDGLAWRAESGVKGSYAVQQVSGSPRRGLAIATVAAPWSLVV
jgi:hypothetical protein